MAGHHWRAALFFVGMQFAASLAPAVSAGQPLAAALEELRKSGLQLIFSSALIDSRLTVDVDPGEGSPQDVARRILAPHGLSLKEVRPNLFTVVRAEQGGEGAPAVGQPGNAVDEPVQVISVYASRYAIEAQQRRPGVQFTREELGYLPGINEDVMRVMRYLPGTASNSLSSRSHVRGGREDELAVYFDGAPLFEPFHFKDVQALLGILEPQSISTVDFYSGVFPVRYGNRISGVLDIQPRAWTGERYNEIGASILYTHVLSQGRLESVPVEWLASVRRGNVDLLASALERDDAKPEFLDAFGRLQFDLPGSKLAAGWLLLDDGLVASLDDERTNLSYRDATSWLSWQLDPIESGRELRVVISRTERHTWRDGSVDHAGSATGEVHDRRAFDTTTGRIEGLYPVSERVRINGGLEWYDYRAHYAYSSDVAFDPVLAAAFARAASVSRREDLSVDGTAYAMHVSALVGLTARTLMDVGLRWDAQRFGAAFEANQLSPRLSLQFAQDPQTLWRLSWGRLSQTERPDELAVQDGDPAFHSAQRAAQLVASMERRPSRSLLFRVEAFEKRVTTPSPAYENLMDPFALLPELAVDRVRIQPNRSHAYGAELSMRWELQPAWLVWASYSRSDVSDDFGDDRVPRTWEQKDALAAGVNWGHGPWGLSANSMFHTGWRRNRLALLPDASVELAPRNSAAWRDYFSLDLRGTWLRPLPYGELRVFLEVDNVTNHGNPCCVDYRTVESPGGIDLRREVSSWLPRIFLLGITWQLP